jgi:hypothetical protein
MSVQPAQAQCKVAEVISVRANRQPSGATQYVRSLTLQR